MTDSIDLDELADESDEEDRAGNRGDWFWRDDADAAAEPAAGTAGGPGTDTDATGPDPADAGPEATTPDATGSDGDGGTAVPHVPRETGDRPVGIPKESGGAGGGPGGGTGGGANGDPAEGDAAAGAAGGPHGGGVDDMSMALTYRAAKRLANPAAAFADASQWTDWFGIVGEVEAHVITKFQRDHSVDADFFNGSGTGPGERLAEIDEHSMFFADRMVVVGLDGQDEPIAEAAGWEFVPLSEAAAKADWELVDAADG